MKKIVLLVLLIIPININAISASSYIIMDQNTNNVLKGSNINESYLIASITKIMTAIVVIENVEDLDKEITVDEEVLKAYGSAIYIEVGEKLTIRDLLYGLMLRSGNDAAIVLANEVSGSMEEFASLMNETVKKLDLEDTIFHNSHGLEDSNGENKSSTYDMAVITSYAMENTDFKKISGSENYTVKSNYKSYSWANKNKLLGKYDYITGGKTGYTEKAGRTLVTTASKDGMDLVVVTINDGNDWNDHISLYEEVFSSYINYKILDKNIVAPKENIYIKNDYNMLIKKDDKENLEIKYELFNKPVGTVVGLAKVYYNEKLVHEENLYKNEESLSWWQKLVGWFKSW